MSFGANQIRLRLANDADVFRWSYGRVTAPDAGRGGLFDPRIFGHTEDYTCACGKVAGGPELAGRICTDCGVALGEAAVQRSTRCGHIELAVPIAHPWDVDHLCSALCVIPVALRSEGASRSLSDRYERILELNASLTRIIERSGESAYAAMARPRGVFEDRRLELLAEFRELVDGDRGHPSSVSLTTLLEREIRELGCGFLAYSRGIGIVFSVSVRV